MLTYKVYSDLFVFEEEKLKFFNRLILLNFIMIV